MLLTDPLRAQDGKTIEPANTIMAQLRIMRDGSPVPIEVVKLRDSKDVRVWR